MNNKGEDTPFELPYNQVKMCRERHWDIEKFASRTGSDLVRSGRKKQKKSYAAALGRKSKNQSAKPRPRKEYRNSNSLMDTLQQILDRLTSLEKRVSIIETLQQGSNPNMLHEIVNKVGNLEDRISSTENNMDMDEKDEFDFSKDYDDNLTLNSWEQEHKEFTPVVSQDITRINC